MSTVACLCHPCHDYVSSSLAHLRLVLLLGAATAATGCTRCRRALTLSRHLWALGVVMCSSVAVTAAWRSLRTRINVVLERTAVATVVHTWRRFRVAHTRWRGRTHTLGWLLPWLVAVGEDALFCLAACGWVQVAFGCICTDWSLGWCIRLLSHRLLHHRSLLWHFPSEVDRVPGGVHSPPAARRTACACQSPRTAQFESIVAVLVSTPLLKRLVSR